jgi:hypothetical protein
MERPEETGHDDRTCTARTPNAGQSGARPVGAASNGPADSDARRGPDQRPDA